MRLIKAARIGRPHFPGEISSLARFLPLSPWPVNKIELGAGLTKRLGTWRDALGELGDRLARGDRAAFAELYDLCADRLHHYLIVRLESRSDADDVLQETFVRLAGARRKLAHVENLAAYAFTVARNEAMRVLARRSREVRNRDTIDATELFCQAAASAIEERETAEQLAAALMRLPAEQREVVELKTYAGLTLAEIAAVTDSPPGTVATRYRTAVAKLKEWLAEKIP
jgi:RNA polymerase sigma-70 factor (ECF subfamily)